MITHRTPCTIVGFDSIAATMTLTYSPTDRPFSVTAWFDYVQDGRDETSEWEFSRELVGDALLNGVAGAGDVVISADGSLVRLLFNSPEGSAIIISPQSVLCDFYSEAIALVPLGTESEHLDWSWLTELTDH